MSTLRLGDSLDVLIDHRGKTPKKLGSDFVESGVPVASASMVDDGVLDLSSARFVSGDVYERWMPEPVRKGDVLLTSEAPLGRVARVPDDRPLVLGQRLFGLRGRRGVLHTGFLFYALQTQAVQADLAGRATGTTVVGIRQSALRDVRIPSFPYAAQQAIAEVLGALDDKIAANERLLDAAEDLAAATFDSLLGDAIDMPLSGLAQFVNGRAFTKDASGTGRVVIRIAELNSGIGGSTVRNDIDVPEEHLARPGDLLFAWSGSLTVHRWFRDEAIINQHIFKVIPNPGCPGWLVHQLLLRKLEEFRAIAKDKATTMGHIQRRHLDEPVPVPPPAEIERAHDLMAGLWSRALAAQQESLTLEEVRDTFLPLLLSGRLQVQDAEKQVEAVV
jgi:type I restriction enzyme S subunit